MNRLFYDLYRRTLSTYYPWAFRKGPCILWAENLYYSKDCGSEARAVLHFLSNPHIELLQ